MFDFLEESHRGHGVESSLGYFLLAAPSAVQVASRLGTFIVQLQPAFVYSPDKTDCCDFLPGLLIWKTSARDSGLALLKFVTSSRLTRVFSLWGAISGWHDKDFSFTHQRKPSNIYCNKMANWQDTHTDQNWLLENSWDYWIVFLFVFLFVFVIFAVFLCVENPIDTKQVVPVVVFVNFLVCDKLTSPLPPVVIRASHLLCPWGRNSSNLFIMLMHQNFSSKCLAALQLFHCIGPVFKAVAEKTHYDFV